MANISLNQSVHLRQAASDYLSQCYQISAHIKDLIDELKDTKKGLQFGSLIEALEMFLESFQIGIEESHNALDVDINPYPSLQSLYLCQKQGADLLIEAADDLTKLRNLLLDTSHNLALYDGFETYSSALEKEIK
ncbi:hypothetical protein [Rickettsiella endosymbiont of Dermanyssus gallinae]|uniref:hypothetical protein n=1 Tax=Rickettsiella endosymbiont of Dermanyssus gallinae TaxID=2856608 RepID=UPI001C529A4C|nr:hypothetical protein [Rickettsiella endosymbiont of Dermanyssus gallinae]